MNGPLSEALTVNQWKIEAHLKTVCNLHTIIYSQYRRPHLPFPVYSVGGCCCSISYPLCLSFLELEFRIIVAGDYPSSPVLTPFPPDCIQEELIIPEGDHD